MSTPKLWKNPSVHPSKTLRQLKTKFFWPTAWVPRVRPSALFLQKVFEGKGWSSCQLSAVTVFYSMLFSLPVPVVCSPNPSSARAWSFEQTKARTKLADSMNNHGQIHMFLWQNVLFFWNSARRISPSSFRTGKNLICSSVKVRRQLGQESPAPEGKFVFSSKKPRRCGWTIFDMKEWHDSLWAEKNAFSSRIQMLVKNDKSRELAKCLKLRPPISEFATSHHNFDLMLKLGLLAWFWVSGFNSPAEET